MNSIRVLLVDTIWLLRDISCLLILLVFWVSFKDSGSVRVTLPGEPDEGESLIGDEASGRGSKYLSAMRWVSWPLFRRL